ncbi:MAG TPA: 2-oxoacid:acceptor oxidoreductase family protein, partial [Vicinamibacterales bacterium]|nr:2-oxoacid:acceptor oxidoreductase family protein [Vicinamibacterales bacterium]
MVALRFHGRGGQGAVIASKLLASAFFAEGWQVQAFPSFGAERTGAPVAAYLRIDHQRITSHYQVYEPDHVIVLDPVLLQAVD